MATTININPALLRSACELAIEYIQAERAENLEKLIDRVMSWQKQGWLSKMLGRKWNPPTREEMKRLIEDTGLGGYEYTFVRNRYGSTLNTAQSLLAAIKVCEDGPISVGFDEFKQLQSFFPEASK